MADRTFYDVLGVGRDATDAELRSAHRRLAKEHHPDLAPADGRDAAKAAFIEVQEAYETLRDENLRAAYDLDLRRQDERTTARAAAAGPRPAPPASPVGGDPSSLWADLADVFPELTAGDLDVLVELATSAARRGDAAFLEEVWAHWDRGGPDPTGGRVDWAAGRRRMRVRRASADLRTDRDRVLVGVAVLVVAAGCATRLASGHVGGVRATIADAVAGAPWWALAAVAVATAVVSSRWWPMREGAWTLYSADRPWRWAALVAAAEVALVAPWLDVAPPMLLALGAGPAAAWAVARLWRRRLAWLDLRVWNPITATRYAASDALVRFGRRLRARLVRRTSVR